MLRKNLVWTGLGQTAFFIVQFAGSVVLARLLSPYELGVYAIAAATVGLLAILQSLGLRSYVVREKTLTPSDISTAFTVNLLLSALLSAAIFAASVVTTRWVSDHGVTNVLRALAVIPLIGILDFLPNARMERGARFHLLVLVGMSRHVIATASTVAFAVAGFSYLSIAYGQICGGLAGALLINVVGREYVQLRLSVTGWRRISLFGAQMLAIAGINALANRASDILLGKISGLQSLGLYTRSSTLFNLFWDNLHIVIGRVLFVDLAGKKRDGQSLRQSYLLIVEIMTAALWPAFAGIAILAKPLFFIVYGPKWVDAALPFSILAISAIIQVSITMTWEIFTICGETAKQARIEIVRATVGTTMFGIGATISLTAAAIGKVLDAAFTMFLYRGHLERMTDTVWADFLPIYLRSALLTLLAVGPAFVLMAVQHNAPDVPLWQLATAIALGIGGWALGLWRTSHPLFAEAKKLVGGILQRPATPA